MIHVFFCCPNLIISLHRHRCITASWKWFDTDWISFEWLDAARSSWPGHQIHLVNEKYRRKFVPVAKTDVIIITSKGQNFNCLCSNVTELLSQQLDSVSQYLPQLLHVHTPRLRCLLIWYELIFNLGNALIKPGLVKENWRGMIMRQGGFLVSKLTISHISLCQHFPALIFD